MSVAAKPFWDRFWPKVDFDGDCWEWTASTNQNGYGQFSISRSAWRVAHRIGYELLVGPIPVGLVLDHLCRNRVCVNPDHLELVTHRVNILRGFSLSAQRARQTHCKRNHEFTAANTQIDALGRRYCRACRAAAARARRSRKVVTA